jgi:CheY-like chemotaxis protein
MTDQKTILIVEDDNLIRNALSRALEQVNITVIEASDGKEGLKQALELHPDGVVADLHMPVMDGYEMVEELRKDSWGKTVPIVVLTADEGTDAVNRALQAGISNYLVKSNMNVDSLVQSILQAIK